MQLEAVVKVELSRSGRSRIRAWHERELFHVFVDFFHVFVDFFLRQIFFVKIFVILSFSFIKHNKAWRISQLRSLPFIVFFSPFLFPPR